ncbi:MAG: ComEC/Rec2 family competence protein [Muribaculaceae bacterium]|nr:ComEC/Rec2 family competence protein [Muribaculaceae bacterium]
MVILVAAVMPLVSYGYKKCSLVLACAAVGWLLAFVNRPSQLPPIVDGESISVSGRVTHRYDTGAGYAVLLDADSVDGVKVQNLRIKVIADCYRAQTNDHFACKGVCTVVEQTERVPLTSWRQAPEVTVFASDITALCQTSGFEGMATSMRRKLIRIITDSPATDGAKAFLIASFIGERTYLDTADSEMLTKVGLAHLLAISGFHVGLIAWIVTLLLWPLRAFRGTFRWLPLLGLVFVWMYIFVTGCMVPAVRAGIMITSAALALLLQRPSAPFNALSLAALIILVFSPYALLEPGFQLSFCATLSLLVWTSVFKDFKMMRRAVARVIMVLTIPVAVTLGTLIPVLWHFRAVPLWFLPANVIVVSVMPLFIFAGLYLVILSACGVTAPSIAWPLDTLYSFIDTVTTTLGSSGTDSYMSIVMSPQAMMVSCMLALALLLLWWTRARLWTMVALVCALGIWPVNALTRYTPAETETYIDLFQGHAVIVMKHGDRVGVWSPSATHDSLVLVRHYSAYASVSGAVPLVVQDFYSDGVHAVRENVLIINGHKMLVLCGADTSKECGCDGIIYCRGTVTPASETVQRHGAGMIYISPDVSAVREAKVSAECAQKGIPYCSLK